MTHDYIQMMFVRMNHHTLVKDTLDFSRRVVFILVDYTEELHSNH